MDAGTKKAAQARLGRIAGQVDGIRRMVDADRYCVDVMQQIGAVQAALGKVAEMAMGAHLATCVSAAVRSGTPRERKKKLDEIMDLVSRYGHLG